MSEDTDMSLNMSTGLTIELTTAQKQAGGEQDSFGNLWFKKPVDLSSINREQLRDLSSGFWFMLEDTQNFTLVGLGNDMEDIGKGLTESSISREYLALAPTPDSVDSPEAQKALERTLNLG